ncbi:MAG: hypothetical protein ACOX6V_00635 [Patescibacteria group bacterium]|jgi:hypothetical protein
MAVTERVEISVAMESQEVQDKNLFLEAKNPTELWLQMQTGDGIMGRYNSLTHDELKLIKENCLCPIDKITAQYLQGVWGLKNLVVEQ